jgi:PhnB protein
MKLTPFLLFDGNCAEAMAFYRSCLGGELTIMKVGDSPMKGQHPPEHQNKVIYASLINKAIELSATDWLHLSRIPRQGNTVGLYMSEATSTELREIFAKLSQGADPSLLDPLRDMPFGSYGHFADKYGVHWFFQGEKQE